MNPASAQDFAWISVTHDLFQCVPLALPVLCVLSCSDTGRASGTHRLDFDRACCEQNYLPRRFMMNGSILPHTVHTPVINIPIAEIQRNASQRNLGVIRESLRL